MIDLLRKNRMFCRFIIYRVFSALGGGIFQLFMLLSVHLLYQNPIYTGIASFLMMAPHFFSFAAGPVIDRANKVRAMRWTTLIEFTAVGLLAFVSFQGSVHVLFMFVVILLYTVAQVFEAPSGGAFLRKIVDECEIMKANSLIDIAATVGGLVVAAFLFGALGGDVELSFIYALSAIFLALSFTATFFLKDTTARIEDVKNEDTFKNYFTELKEGYRYVRQTKFLLYFLIAGVVASFFIDVAYTNMPEFVTTHVGAQGYVVLTVATLAGGLVASILAGNMGDKFRVGILVCFMWILAGVLRIGFAYALPVSYIGSLAIIFGYFVIFGFSRIVRATLIQKTPKENMVARVGTVHTTFLSVSGALGALAGGFIGYAVTSLAHVFVLYGVVYILLGVVLLLSPSIRKLPRVNEITSDEDTL